MKKCLKRIVKKPVKNGVIGGKDTENAFTKHSMGKRKNGGEQRLKRLTDKSEAESQENCKYCEKPLLQKNFRDAVKDHCHVTGRYRGAAHSHCNYLLRIYPNTEEIPVVFHNLKGYDAHHLMQSSVEDKRKGDELYYEQHGEVHHIFNRRLAFH